MIVVKRTNSENLDFKKLVSELDVDLGAYYKEEQFFYGQLNKTNNIKHVVVAYDEHKNAVGCGGIKEFSKKEMEIKRMYVLPNNRGKGIAAIVLEELEKWSCEMKFEECILETLKEKTYAISFYQKNNYVKIPSFGAYVNAENSICFGKKIK